MSYRMGNVGSRILFFIFAFYWIKRGYDMQQLDKKWYKVEGTSLGTFTKVHFGKKHPITKLKILQYTAIISGITPLNHLLWHP